MKKLTLVVMSLALLLVTATSSFAAIITIPGSTGWDKFTPWSADVTLAPGTDSAFLTLNLQLLGDWNTSTSLRKTLARLDGFTGEREILGIVGLQPVSTGSSFYTVSGYIPLVDYKGGVYSLGLASSGPAFPGSTLAAFNVVSGSVATTPIPAAFLLLGSGLVGLFGVKRVRRGNAAA